MSRISVVVAAVAPAGSSSSDGGCRTDAAAISSVTGMAFRLRTTGADREPETRERGGPVIGGSVGGGDRVVEVCVVDSATVTVEKPTPAFDAFLATVA